MAGDGASNYGVFACNTSAGNQTFAIGGVTNTPVGAMFYGSAATVSGTLVPDGRISYGAAATGEWTWGHMTRTALSSSDTTNAWRDDACLTIVEWTGSAFVQRYASFVSFGAGSVTVDWIDPPTSAYLIVVELIHGADALAMASFESPTIGTGTATITPGQQFDPIYIVSGNLDNAPAPPAIAGPLMVSFGCADTPGDPQNCAVGNFSQDARVSQNIRAYLHETACAVQVNQFGISEALQVSRHGGDAAPFDFDVIRLVQSSRTRRFGYMAAFHDREHSITYVDSPSGSDTLWTVTTGFEPGSIKVIATAATVTGYVSSGQQPDTRCHGLSDFTTTACLGYYDQNSAATSHSESFLHEDKLAVVYNGVTPTVVAELGEPTATATGFTCPVTTAPTTAQKWLVFAVEAVAGVPPSFNPAWAVGADRIPRVA